MRYICDTPKMPESDKIMGHLIKVLKEHRILSLKELEEIARLEIF